MCEQKDDRIHAAVGQLLVAVAAKRLTRPMEEPQIAMQPGHVSFGTVAHHVVKQQGIAFQKRDDRVVTPPRIFRRALNRNKVRMPWLR